MILALIALCGIFALFFGHGGHFFRGISRAASGLIVVVVLGWVLEPVLLPLLQSLIRQFWLAAVLTLVGIIIVIGLVVRFVRRPYRGAASTGGYDPRSDPRSPYYDSRCDPLSADYDAYFATHTRWR